MGIAPTELAGTTNGPEAASKDVAGRSPMQIALGRLKSDKIAVFCFSVVMLFVLIAIFAGQIADFFNVDTEVTLASERVAFDGMPKTGPPNHGFEMDHPFGLAPATGEDNLAYWLFGARTSLLIAGTGTVVASFIGIIFGLISGYVGGLLDRMLSFVTDFFLTLPLLLAALSLSPLIADYFLHIPEQFDADKYARVQTMALISILGVLGWMGTARLIRGEVLSLREREFVQAARVMGMRTRRILFKELMPNLAAPIVVSMSLMLPAFVALEAGLAYLGIGVTTGASWGQTILKATKYFDIYPLYLIEPLLGIVALVICLNLLGDAIRDALDPKTRR
jgi:peptide/nickel transport system permease protein